MKLFPGILMVVCFSVSALQVAPHTTANIGAVHVMGSSGEICEQESVTYSLKNNGSAPVNSVQAHVFMVANGDRHIADDWFAITGIGSCVKAGSTCELLVHLIDTDGLRENQEFIVAITIGGETVELPLQLSSNDKR
ncbi:MAG: hypothetical protein LBC04_04035 [Holosporaceae bacterium]|jgi:hypothetical protein|nr:hypothetical protein [Holosporaceae bacterium]